MDKTARILIVDDTELNREVLEGLVASLGHEPVVVDSGKMALKLLKKGEMPDLILLDILMPEVSGFDVLKQVKDNEELREIPIIMISIVDEMESIVRCIEYGADDFMVKPFNAILLKARINACLEKKEYRDKQKQFHFWLAESYQKLQKVEQIRDEMYNMIVHDMNNSLATILGESELLMDISIHQEDQEIKDSVDNIYNSGQEIKTLVRSLLDIAKMEKGSLAAEKESVDIVKIINDACQQYEAVIKKRHGTLKKIFSSPSIIHDVDESLFRRILQNLLSNAVKYGMTADRPEISIFVANEEEKLCLVISDNGQGIPDDKNEKIFRKYYKLKTENKGLGLGLAFCKMAMEVMGGTITSGRSSTGGASFTLKI